MITFWKVQPDDDVHVACAVSSIANTRGKTPPSKTEPLALELKKVIPLSYDDTDVSQ